MALPYIVTGDDTLLPVTLKKDGVTFPISGTGVVKVKVVSEDHGKAYTEEVSQSRLTSGANWTNSLVVVLIPGSYTSAIKFQGKAYLEIQVADPLKTSWFVQVEIIRGHVD
jgi:hypothetical protein